MPTARTDARAAVGAIAGRHRESSGRRAVAGRRALGRSWTEIVGFQCAEGCRSGRGSGGIGGVASRASGR